MILSDRDIRARLEQGDLVVDPITDWDLQLQPASLDVRLGRGFAVYQLPHLPCIDPRDKVNIDAVTTPVELPDGEPFVLHPGEFAPLLPLQTEREPTLPRYGGVEARGQRVRAGFPNIRRHWSHNHNRQRHCLPLPAIL